ncbi:GNAT family N-acetyltransferase [Lacticaseibacillus yichunensis]|uniref:GNAT family N-acetyltransferase n=1 Tax=Lacticaseibacillus yichunensis TaxID=2486015 RepID=A0ABW4CR86_9LACO|nr:GNAT family N-acetyltransferase [Lacticaseibacillus yichunensis]
MSITFTLATHADLARVIEIYNEIIPSRLATADLTPVTVASREAWFAAFDPATRPLWLMKDGETIAGWVGLESFYGRPAYQRTCEISIYIDAAYRHQGLGQQALDYVAGQLPALNVDTLLAYIFSHNAPSLGLFTKNGFARWAHLPEIADLDGRAASLDIMGRHYRN